MIEQNEMDSLMTLQQTTCSLKVNKGLGGIQSYSLELKGGFYLHCNTMF